MVKKGQHKTKLQVEDTVIKISGRDKGQKGEIQEIDLERGLAIVKGINIRKVRQRPTQENPKAEMIDMERPVRLTSLMYYDSKLKEPVRLGYKFVDDKGKKRKVRVTRPSKRGRAEAPASREV